MKKNILQLALLICLVFIGAAHSQTHNMTDASMQTLQKTTGKTFDVYWMSQMIEHHNGAVEMAKSILENGKKDFVQKAAKSIVSAQSTEIKTLNNWLKNWYNTRPNLAQQKLMRADMQAMLKMSGNTMPGMNMAEDPDKAFLEAMIPHHQSAVAMAQLALKKALKPELKTFAKQVIAAQSKEIKQYQAWLTKWK